jgi:tRNA G46 methylase TrmB
MASILKKNCSIVVTTDSLNYYEYIVSIFKNKDLIFCKMEHEELKITDPLYGISSYQRKAINRNSKIYKIEIFTIINH